MSIPRIAFLYACTFTLLSTTLKAQTPEIVWQTYLGGIREDYIYNTQPCNSAQMIMAGTTQSDIAGTTNCGGYDAYLAVMNNDGTIAWELSKGGPSNDYCYNAW